VPKEFKATIQGHPSSVDSWLGGGSVAMTTFVNVCHGSLLYRAGTTSTYSADSPKSKRLGKDCRFHYCCNRKDLNQWFLNFFDAFLPLLILELLFPPLIVRVVRRLLTTIGTMVFIDDSNLISKSGTKRICCQKKAPKFVTKTCDSPLNKLQI